MPCYDHRDDPSYIRAELQEDTKRQVEAARKSFLHNSPVAELLCYTMKKLSLANRLALMDGNAKLAHWWQDHQERDRKVAADKVAAEKKRKADIRSQIKKLQDSL